MKKIEEEPLFVGIRAPAVIRRNLLEASKGIVESLQKYEGFKSTRGTKVELVHKLRDDIKEISKLIYQLRASLPTIQFKSQPKKKPKVEKVVRQEKIKKKVEVSGRHRTELDKLEAELGEIEGKLNSIS